MTLPLFNPPAPHADPTIGGWDQKTGARCGNCVCVPRFWAIDVPYSGSDPYAGLFGGRHVLTRQLPAFERGDLQSDCHWSCGIDLSPAGFLQAGSIALAQTALGPGTTAITDWYVQFTGADFIGLGRDVLIYWMHGSFAPHNEPETIPFRCLSPNTFYPRDDLGSLGFLAAELPRKITIEPFWP